MLSDYVRLLYRDLRKYCFSVIMHDRIIFSLFLICRFNDRQANSRPKCKCLKSETDIYIYIYIDIHIHICVCVCVCVYDSHICQINVFSSKRD
jgi:hypothetical protein